MATLTDLDDFYKDTICSLPKDERILYCIRHLDKIQALLLKNAGMLNIQQKEKLMEMIQATQEEIRILEK